MCGGEVQEWEGSKGGIKGLGKDGRYKGDRLVKMFDSLDGTGMIGDWKMKLRADDMEKIKNKNCDGRNRDGRHSKLGTGRLGTGAIAVSGAETGDRQVRIMGKTVWLWEINGKCWYESGMAGMYRIGLALARKAVQCDKLIFWYRGIGKKTGRCRGFKTQGKRV